MPNFMAFFTLQTFVPDNCAKTGCTVAKTFARYRGRLGPSSPKLQTESENEFQSPLGPGAQKLGVK